MWVTRITSPVRLVLGLLGRLIRRFRAVTGGPPVTVYPATRAIWGILGRVTGPTRRFWVWRIVFSVPPRPHLSSFLFIAVASSTARAATIAASVRSGSSETLTFL